MMNKEWMVFPAILLAFVLAGSGCSKEPELTAEQKQALKMKQERENFKDLQSWVDESSKREKRASALQGFLKKDLCKALTTGQRFKKLKTQPKVAHNLQAHPALPLPLSVPIGQWSVCFFKVFFR